VIEKPAKIARRRCSLKATLSLAKIPVSPPCARSGRRQVTGRKKDWLDDGQLGERADARFVGWFLLERCKEQKARRPEERQPHWLPVDAIEREQQVFPETKTLLRKAAAKIAEIKSASQAGRITHQT
jgi:hypothetical protein